MKTDLHQISTTVLCAITVAAFSAGAVAAGWAVGAFSTMGNAVDWVAALGGGAAALGTWAIGIGANNYAREAHLQRINEQMRGVRNAIEKDIRLINVLLIKLRKVQRLDAVGEHALASGVLGPMFIPPMLAAIHGLKPILDTLRWSADEGMVLDVQSREMLADIEHDVLTVGVILEMAVSSREKNDYEKFRADFRVLAEACQEAHSDASLLIDLVEARLQRLEAEIGVHGN